MPRGIRNKPDGGTPIGRYKVHILENGNVELHITRGLKIAFTPHEIVQIFNWLFMRMPYFQGLVDTDFRPSLPQDLLQGGQHDKAE